MPELGAIKGNVFPSRAKQPSASRHGGDAGETKEEIKTTTTTNKLLLRLKKTNQLETADGLSCSPPHRLLLSCWDLQVCVVGLLAQGWGGFVFVGLLLNTAFISPPKECRGVAS